MPSPRYTPRVSDVTDDDDNDVMMTTLTARREEPGRLDAVDTESYRGE